MLCYVSAAKCVPGCYALSINEEKPRRVPVRLHTQHNNTCLCRITRQHTQTQSSFSELDVKKSAQDMQQVDCMQGACTCAQTAPSNRCCCGHGAIAGTIAAFQSDTTQYTSPPPNKHIGWHVRSHVTEFVWHISFNTGAAGCGQSKTSSGPRGQA